MDNNLILREANKSDLKFLFELANDEMCRAFAFNKKNILIDEHKDWFYEKLRNKQNSRIFIAINNKNERIGQIRFERRNNNAY